MLCLDGAFLTDTDSPVFRRIAPPTRQELQLLVERIAEHPRCPMLPYAGDITPIKRTSRGKLSAAAASLGVDKGNFHRLVKRLGLR